MEITPVHAQDAPAPGGHYSQAVVYNGLVFVAGQLSIDPQTGEKRLGSIEEQTEQALKNVGAILRAANSDLSRVLKMTVYVSDIGLWGRVNEVYARVLGEHRPARAVVPTGELHYGFLVEIDAIAATYA
jgi:2-iminobutanoate/2-iminopropanoate deaminase